MAARDLPQELVEAGERVSAASDAAGLCLAAAAWIYDHELNEWRFYVVSPLVGIVEKKRLYTAISYVIRNIDVPDDFSIVDVHLDNTSGFMFNLIGSVIQFDSGMRAFFRNCTFNGVRVDAVIYKFDSSKKTFEDKDLKNFEYFERLNKKRRRASKASRKSVEV